MLQSSDLSRSVGSRLSDVRFRAGRKLRGPCSFRSEGPKLTVPTQFKLLAENWGQTGGVHTSRGRKKLLVSPGKIVNRGRGAGPTCAPPLKGLPRPSRFSTDGHYVRMYQTGDNGNVQATWGAGPAFPSATLLACAPSLRLRSGRDIVSAFCAETGTLILTGQLRRDPELLQ